MFIGKVCAGEVITLSQNASVFEAAVLMQKYPISCVVIIEGADMARNPIGLLTDNDIVVKAVATKQDVKHIAVSQLMDTHLLILKEDTMVRDVLHLMNSNKVNRGVILNKEGRIIGLATSDDLMLFLAHELAELAEITQNQLEA